MGCTVASLPWVLWAWMAALGTRRRPRNQNKCFITNIAPHFLRNKQPFTLLKVKVMNPIKHPPHTHPKTTAKAHCCGGGEGLAGDQGWVRHHSWASMSIAVQKSQKAWNWTPCLYYEHVLLTCLPCNIVLSTAPRCCAEKQSLGLPELREQQLSLHCPNKHMILCPLACPLPYEIIWRASEILKESLFSGVKNGAKRVCAMCLAAYENGCPVTIKSEGVFRLLLECNHSP